MARVRFVLQEKKDVLYETCSHLPELVFSSSQETNFFFQKHRKKVFIYNKMVPVKTFFRLENVFITLEDVSSLVN